MYSLGAMSSSLNCIWLCGPESTRRVKITAGIKHSVKFSTTVVLFGWGSCTVLPSLIASEKSVEGNCATFCPRAGLSWSRFLLTRFPPGPVQWELHLSSLILNGCVCGGGRQLGHASAAFRIPNRAAKNEKRSFPKAQSKSVTAAAATLGFQHQAASKGGSGSSPTMTKLL